LSASDLRVRESLFPPIPFSSMVRMRWISTAGVSDRFQVKSFLGFLEYRSGCSPILQIMAYSLSRTLLLCFSCAAFPENQFVSRASPHIFCPLSRTFSKFFLDFLVNLMALLTVGLLTK